MIAVTVIGSVGMLTALTATSLAMQQSREVEKRGAAIQARTAAYSCANVAMLRLRRGRGYGGNEKVKKNKVDCDIKPVGSNGAARTIHAQATVNGQTSRIKVEIQDIDYFFLNSWTEIPPQ
jgi:hypothetical protein